MTQTNEHRLPDTVAPRAYRVTLEPDLDACRFQGEVEIDLDVRVPTREVVLHAADLEIAEATSGGRPLEVRLDPARERTTLAAPDPFPAGPATVRLRFSGALGDKMRGFYRSRYKRPDGTEGVMATTQFESTSARRAFPCFDEPALKARFDVTLVVPKDRVAISNMPALSEEPADGGRKRVRYARSPVMPTYLLAFIVGEFESIEGRTKSGVPVRVFTTPGRIGLGRFALDTAIRGLEFFNDYYGIPYEKALPKCDLVAIPDFEFGAMENWGAITFRETAIFVDPEKSSVPQRRRVAEVVLHELAHQWFGNLVSPEWWSFLWLNESFATYMAYKASNALFPEWKVWEEYLAQITSAGKSLDSLRSSHPVEVIVRNPSEVDQIFDAISYNKGGSVLRMLEGAIGEQAFRDGIRRYLERHAYANATTDDLWRALGEVAGADVSAMMDGWTRQIGFPVVLAAREGDALRLRQERFFLDRDPEGAPPDSTLWDVPLPCLASSDVRRVERLSSRETSIAVSGERWVKLNEGQTGFYLVHYADDGRALAGALAERKLPAEDRFGLQEDAYSLMRANYLSVPAYLKLVSAYAGEDNYHVWSGLMEGVAALEEIFAGDPQIPRLQAWARSLLGPVVKGVGWDEKPGEPHERVLLRATTLSAAVHFGDAEAVAAVRERFAALRREWKAVSPNLRSMTLSGAARHGGDEILDQLTELYGKADLPEVKVQVLRAMGAFRREAPLRRAVAFALSDKVRLQDAMYVFAGVPIEVKPAAWGVLKENWRVIDERYGKSVLIAHFISSAAGGIPSEDHARDVEAFFRDHPAPYATEKIRQTLEGIRARAKFRARNRAGLSTFFA